MDRDHAFTSGRRLTGFMFGRGAEERLVQGVQGYLTSWAALRGGQHLHGTLEAVRPILERYLASRGRTFAGEVQRKRARLMSVTAFLDGEDPDAA